MKKILLIICLFTLTSFHTGANIGMSDTWNGNTGSQIPTGNAVRDGASATGLYTVDVTIPAGMNKEAFTKADWTTYTTVPTGNAPLVSMSNTECPTQDEVLGVF